MIAGWCRTREVFERYNIVSEVDLQEAVRRLEDFGHVLGKSRYATPELTPAEKHQVKEPGPSAGPPGPWATFARNALHDVTCGWDERASAVGQSALTELSQLADVITGRKSWRQAVEEARCVNRDALASAQRSRQAGNRTHPVAAFAGGLVPQLSLGVITGELSARLMAPSAMAA